MAASTVGRVLLINVLLIFFEYNDAQGTFNVPDVTIEAFSPQGFRASIPDAPGLTLFVFQGNVNRKIDKTSVGALKGEVLQSTSGRWVYESPELQLKVGDVINYYVFVSVNRAGYIKDNLSYTITELITEGSTASPRPPNCLPTVTQLRGGNACGGQTIFEDDFSTLRENVWQIEQYLPISHPEYPFVSFQRLQTSPVVYVSNGNLYITPKIQQNIPGFTNESIYMGNLDLFNSCTSRAEECYIQASGPDILPPVVSGRVTSSGVAFKYGTVSIRAKLPQGDWIYPEILLEPYLKKYGSTNYASGVVKIASSRGNKELRIGLKDIGNKVLYGGPIMDVECRQQLQSSKTLPGEMWGDQFHVYSVTWTPQFIALSVDGVEWWRVTADDGLRKRFPPSCSHLPRMLLEKGTKMAPFDDYFYITLGVAVGGITEFQDDAYSAGGRPKPWRNSGRKGMLNFWEDLPAWSSTWTQPQLVIDYVKIVAL